MAFLCPSRVGRAAKNKTNKAKVPRLGGRLTGSDSIDSLVRVGLKKQHNFKPESKLIITQDFKARVNEELDVYRGQEVYFLYEESEWTYVLTDDDKEGFVPSVLCSKFTDIRPASVTTQEDGGKNSSDVKSETSESSIKKFSDPSFETDSYSNERWSDFSKLSSSSLKVDTSVQEVRWFRKTSHGQFIVLFNFTALDENDISVERAELVEVLNIEDPDWSWIRRYNGEEGFVPKSYICPVEPLLAQEKINQSHGKNSQRKKLPSQQQQQLDLDHKSEQSLVYPYEPSSDNYPLTDAAKRENIALSSAVHVHGQQQFHDSSNRKPISPTSRQTDLLKSIDINQQHHSNHNKHSNPIKFSNINSDNITNEDFDTFFHSPKHNSGVGAKQVPPYQNHVATKTKQFIENVPPPEEPPKQEFDKYRSAINAEIKQLGLLKKVSKNSNPDSNLVPSRKNIKTLSNESPNKKHLQQNDIHYNQSRLNIENESSTDIVTRGSSPVRRTSPFRFKSSANNGEGKMEEHGNWVNNQTSPNNRPRNRERGESPSRQSNSPSYRESSPARLNISSTNRGPNGPNNRHRGESTSRQNNSPSYEESSPARLNVSTINRERGKSPSRQNNSPSHRESSPTRLNVSAINRERGKSPSRQNNSPSHRESSPTRLNVSAINRERGKSPSRQNNSPSHRESSPTRLNVIAINRDRGISPSRQNNSPSHRESSPARLNVSAVNRGPSPVRQDLRSDFGANLLNSPGNETASHGRQGSGVSQISVNDALKSCDITEFILLYDYVAQSKNDLTVKRGDIVYVDTTDQNDQQWLWVYCPQWHKYGYVPRSYVKVPIKTTL